MAVMPRFQEASYRHSGSFLQTSNLKPDVAAR